MFSFFVILHIVLNCVHILFYVVNIYYVTILYLLVGAINMQINEYI